MIHALILFYKNIHEIEIILDYDANSYSTDILPTSAVALSSDKNICDKRQCHLPLLTNKCQYE